MLSKAICNETELSTINLWSLINLKEGIENDDNNNRRQSRK